MADSPYKSSSVTDANHFQARIAYIADMLGNAPDLTKHVFLVSPGIEGCCLFIETLVDKKKIEDDVIRTFTKRHNYDAVLTADNVVPFLFKRIPVVPITESTDASFCVQALLQGKCVLMISIVPAMLLLDAAKFYHRPMSEPQTETTVRGPQEAFNEDIMAGIGLLRKRIRSSDLRLEQITLGTTTQTKLYMAYLHNLASEEVVDTFRQRIQTIHTDSILDAAYVEEWIQDDTFTIFPTLLNTERPDVATAHILEGRVAVMVEGTPITLIGPITFMQFFRSPDDYYQGALIATLLLWLRLLAFGLAVFVPAFYIAGISFHQALIPHSLLINISAQREGVPFTGFVEAIMMMITFEILREAGLRMPRVAGQAISIVGALVLGQAAVEAGLVSSAMVIVVSITAISNFVSPFYNFGTSQRLLQFSFMLLAGFAGLFGVLCGFMFTIVHLAALESFSVPYLSPLAPMFLSDWKDTLLRVPRSWMTTFPRMNRPQRKER